MTPVPATRLAVFDCDGTLVDGQHDIHTAMIVAFATLRLPPPSREAVRQIVGLSLPIAMRRLLPAGEPEQWTALVEAYKYAYRSAREAGRIGEPLYDGIRPLLDGLQADGWAMAVATGKSDRGLAHCLATHGLADHFISLQTADRHPSKPHPAMLEAAMFEAAVLPQDSVMIGDTSFDMAMARAVGVRALGVAWGYHSVEQLLAAGADAVARDPDHLRELLG